MDTAIKLTNTHLKDIDYVLASMGYSPVQASMQLNRLLPNINQTELRIFGLSEAVAHCLIMTYLGLDVLFIPEKNSLLTTVVSFIKKAPMFVSLPDPLVYGTIPKGGVLRITSFDVGLNYFLGVKPKDLKFDRIYAYDTSFINSNIRIPPDHIKALKKSNPVMFKPIGSETQP